jgi:small redox-active disulfide protein 2
MNIKILGTGCAKCHQLEAVARVAVERLHVDAVIEQVTEPSEIVSWGVMSTPALVVDDAVVLVGRVPDAGEIERLLTTRR